jgi:hypothetical protein
MQQPTPLSPWQSGQATLLPPSARMWSSHDQQLYFLLNLVDELVLSQILIPAQAKDTLGNGF